MIFTLGPALEEETKQCQYELEGQRPSRVFGLRAMGAL